MTCVIVGFFSSFIRLLLESYQRKQDWGFQKMISTFQHLVSGRYSTVLTFLVYPNNVHITVTVWAVYRFESKLIITCVCMLLVNITVCTCTNKLFPWIVAVPGLITSISRIIAPFRLKYLKQLPSSNNHTFSFHPPRSRKMRILHYELRSKCAFLISSTKLLIKGFHPWPPCLVTAYRHRNVTNMVLFSWNIISLYQWKLPLKKKKRKKKLPSFLHYVLYSTFWIYEIRIFIIWSSSFSCMRNN